MGAFHSPGDFNRAQVAMRANAWVKDGIYYSQTSWYNGYRQDCSGFVSMAWGLGKSYVTWTLPEVAWPIHKSDLAMGDIMLNVDDHVVIFDKWANASHTAYWDWELAGSTNRPVHRVVPYPFWTSDSWKYKPYRFAVSPRYTGKTPPRAAGLSAQGTQTNVTAPSPAPKPAPKQPSSAPKPKQTAPAQPARRTPAPKAATTKPPRQQHDTSAGTRAPSAASAPARAHAEEKRVLAAEATPGVPARTLLVLLKELVAWLAD